MNGINVVDFDYSTLIFEGNKCHNDVLNNAMIEQRSISDNLGCKAKIRYGPDIY